MVELPSGNRILRLLWHFITHGPSVYLFLGSRRYRFFYQPVSVAAICYALPTLKKAPTRVPTRHWFPGDYGTSQSSYVFSLLFYQGIHMAAVAFLVS